MSDVFISYASEDRDRAGELAGALGALGWSVWWDRKIITGQAFDLAIERELETAKSVIVLWSNHSIGSEWVRNEAAFASERGVLVPAIIESVKLPLEFRRKQTADLVGWQGEPSHSGFQALCEGVTSAIGGAPLNRPIPRQKRKSRWSPSWAVAAIAAIAVAVGFGIYSTGPWRTTTPAPVPQSDRSENGTPSGSRKPSIAVIELADLVIGTYSGDVIADSQGGSRSDVLLTITRLDRSKVRVTSDYRRLGTVDVTLTRIGNQILNADGDTPFISSWIWIGIRLPCFSTPVTRSRTEGTSSNECSQPPNCGSFICGREPGTGAVMPDRVSRRLAASAAVPKAGALRKQEKAVSLDPVSRGRT